MIQTIIATIIERNRHSNIVTKPDWPELESGHLLYFAG